MNINQFEWLQRVIKGATAAEHVFPEMAGCEAALESAWGTSALAREGNNLFGMKASKHPQFGTFVLPTKEFLNSVWVEVDATWVKYDTVAKCFEDRMETLQRLEGAYPHYARALAAVDPDSYVQEVSQSWSTDPGRAQKCIAIYNSFKDLTSSYVDLASPDA